MSEQYKVTVRYVREKSRCDAHLVCIDSPDGENNYILEGKDGSGETSRQAGKWVSGDTWEEAKVKVSEVINNAREFIQTKRNVENIPACKIYIL